MNESTTMVSMNIGTINDVNRISKAIATLDAIIMQDWALRYYSFNSRWGSNSEMASMRNGRGDHYFVLFASGACMIKGFTRDAQSAETEIPQNEFYANIPSNFSVSFLREPAFSIDEVSFVFWRLQNDATWTMRPIGMSATETGAASLLRIMIAGPHGYHAWATDYYERDLPYSAVESIFQEVPVNQNLASQLNPDFDRTRLCADLDEIRYPSGL